MQSADNPKRSALLPGWYADMHAAGKFSGETYKAYLGELAEFLGRPLEGLPSVLDFGCGPNGGLSTLGLPAGVVTAYDPYVPRFSADPWKGRSSPYALVFSADVLEHLTVAQLRRLAVDLEGSKAERVFLVVATRPAMKAFPNGDNVHLTIEAADWWRGFLQAALPSYKLAYGRSDVFSGCVSLGFRRRGGLDEN